MNKKAKTLNIISGPISQWQLCNQWHKPLTGLVSFQQWAELAHPCAELAHGLAIPYLWEELMYPWAELYGLHYGVASSCAGGELIRWTYLWAELYVVHIMEYICILGS